MEEDRIESIRRNSMAISMTDEDWDELESFLRSRHPDLKESNFRLCMLLRLELNNQELKRFYGIESPSISALAYIFLHQNSQPFTR